VTTDAIQSVQTLQACVKCLPDVIRLFQKVNPKFVSPHSLSGMLTTQADRFSPEEV